jgi:hypothetical protein
MKAWWAAIACAVVAAAPACVHTHHGVAYHVRRAAGQGAIDCGHFYQGLGEEGPTGAQVAAMYACATAAHREGRAFSFFVESAGKDSLGAAGLIGTPSREIKSISYESAPCGDEDHCDEEFIVRKCAAPASGVIDAQLPCP